MGKKGNSGSAPYNGLPPKRLSCDFTCDFERPRTFRSSTNSRLNERRAKTTKAAKEQMAVRFRH